MRWIALLLIALPLAAFSKTISETKGTYVYNGQTYESITREFERRNGTTYSRRSIRIGASFVTCSATDDRDCDGAIYDFRARRNF